MSARTRELPRRSCLSVPGSSEKMLGKAPGLPADMVFLDLEDSVSPLEKEAARAKVVNAIKTQDWGDKVLCVRINVWDTEVDGVRRDRGGRPGRHPPRRGDAPEGAVGSRGDRTRPVAVAGRDQGRVSLPGTSASRRRSRRPAA